MNTICEEERNRFITGEGSDSKSLNEVENTTVSFLDGYLNKHKGKKYAPVIVKCKSVELLREQADNVCLQNNLSKSVNIVNDKQCILQLSLNKLNSQSENLIKGEEGNSSCKCNHELK